MRLKNILLVVDDIEKRLPIPQEADSGKWQSRLKMVL